MMRRFMALLLAALFLVTAAAAAENMDFASMSDEELHSIIDGARSELTKRELVAAEDVVLFEQDGVTVYLTGNHDTYGDDSVYLELEVVVVNDADQSLGVGIDSASINGWNVFGGGIPGTDAGKKQKGSLLFCISDAEAYSFEEIEDIELDFYVYSEETYETVFSVDTVALHFEE